MKQKYQTLIIFGLTLCLSYFSVKPLLSGGFFPMHDDTQPARIYVMSNELRQGIFPVRMVSGLGYNLGYPLYNFYAPGPYYMGSLFHLSGLDLIWSTKLMFLTAMILSLVFMFLLANKIAGPLGAMTASLFYLYAPYHAVNLYVRGAVGELFAYAFLPLFVLGLYQKKIIPAVIGLAAVFLSHNILGFLTALFIILWFSISLIYKFLRGENQKFNLFLITVFILALGLSAFFIFPAFLEKDFTRISTLTIGGSNYENHFVTLGQLWNSAWGFGGSIAGVEDGLSFKIGKLHLLTGVSGFLVLIYLFLGKKLKKTKWVIYLTSLAALLISIFLMLPSAGFLYKIIPFLPYVQYPWRFLNFVLLSLSLLMLPLFLLPAKFKKISSTLTAVILIPLVLFLNAKYFRPKFLTDVKAGDYISGLNLTYRISGISDEYLNRDVILPSLKSEVAGTLLGGNGLEIKVIKDSGNRKILEVTANEKSQVTANLADFPGWQYFIDGQNKSYQVKNGLIRVDIPQGRHKIEFVFKNTPVRFWSNTISFLSFFLILYLSLSNLKNLWLENTRSK